MHTVEELKAMLNEVMTKLGIHRDQDGRYSVDAEPECFECETFEDAFAIALERERRATHEEIAAGINLYLLGVERKCIEARTQSPQVIQ